MSEVQKSIYGGSFTKAFTALKRYCGRPADQEFWHEFNAEFKGASAFERELLTAVANEIKRISGNPYRQEKLS